MPTKVYSDAMYAFMGLNYNEQEPVGISKDSNVTDDQEPKYFFTKANVTDADADADADADMVLNEYAILKQINAIT